MIGVIAASRVQIPSDFVVGYKGDSLTDLKGVNNIVKQSAAGVMQYTTNHRGVANSAFLFDGTNRVHNATSGINLSSTDKVSLSYWFKTNSLTNDLIIAEHSINFNDNNAFVASVNNGGNINTIGMSSHQSTNYNKKKTTRTNMCDNNWHHIVATIDRSQTGVNEISFYVDGVYDSGVTIGTHNNDHTLNFGNLTLNIGGRSGGTFNNIGSLCNFRLYPRVLTQAEVTALYNE